MPGQIPKDKYININTICDQIDECIENFLDEMKIDRDYKSLVSIKHSTVNYMFSCIYEQLFKPDRTLKNNQKSYIDYNDLELMQVLANKFIKICQRFNKSLGLMSFCYFTGMSLETLERWIREKELNPSRYAIIKTIRENHKAQQIALLNESPVGAMAVANNDTETGLQWAKNQTTLNTANAVFILPSERSGRLKLDKVDD